MGNVIDQLKEIQAKQDIQEQQSDIEMVEELEKLQTKNESKAKVEELEKAIYQKTIKNIVLSESLRTEINKDDFSDKDKTIDTLLYTIGIMAKDNLFYQTNVLKLKGYQPKYKA
jgi:hypothetical protein